jgi:hypothetical protein
MKSVFKTTSVVPAVIAGLLATILVMASYLLFEPQVMSAQASDTDVFTVRQTILGELAFVANATDVVMTPNISGIAGGTSNGTATVAVRANNATGYNMTIRFSSTTAMLREGGNGFISNYTPATPGTPDLNFAIPTGTAEFAYSVFPADADDAVQLFEVNTGACNNGAGTPTAGSCWYGTANASNTVQIINRPDATPPGGATTTLTFKVGVDANPSPALPTGFYTATATLTATEN